MTQEELTLQKNSINEARKNINTALGAPSKLSKMEAARDNRDPLSLGSWEEQGASVEGKVLRLHNDPKFQNLSQGGQNKLLGQIYDTYVTPAYQKAGKQIPDRDTWLAGARRAEMLNPVGYGADKTSQKIEDFAMGAYHEANSFSLYGARILKENFLRSYGLGPILGLPPIAGHRNFDSKPMQALKNATDTVFDKWQRSAQNNINDANYYFATHPRDGLLGGAARWTGEQVISLPLYVSGVGEELVTERLMASAAGKFAAHGIDAGLTNLAISMVESGRVTPSGQDVLAGATGAVVGGAIGTASAKLFDKVGQWLERASAGEKGLKVANDAAIKKWSTEGITTGGDPLAQATIHAASEELRTTGIEPPPKGPIDTSGAAPPSKPEAPASTRMPPDVRKERDPSLHALIEGDKMSLQSIALRHYGMPYEKLPQELQDKVDIRRLELMEEAKYEVPIHKEELNKQEIEKELTQDLKTNPYLSKRAQKYKELFGTDYVKDTVEAAHAHQTDQIAQQVGIKNPVAAGEKLAPEGTLEERLGPKPPKEQRISAEKIIANRKATIAGHNEAPIQAVGATLNVKNMDLPTFIKYLSKQDGGLVKYEDPFHQMLMHFRDRRQLPNDVSNKLMTEIKSIIRSKNKDLPDPIPFNAKDLDLYAERAGLHIQMLAQSGRLTSERNMFRSTNLFGAPTQWQTDLNTEIDREELAFLKNTIKMHPDSLKTVNTFLKILQNNRTEGILHPRQWRDYNHAISMLLSGEGKEARAYSKTLEEAYGTVPRGK